MENRKNERNEAVGNDMRNIHLVNRNFHDLNPVQIGFEHCRPKKSFGPHVRKHTLIHYVVSGTGKLFKNGEVYTVRAGEAFLILPDEVTTYEADDEDPWYYQWIGFDGALAEEFRSMPAVFPFPAEIIQKMIDSVGTDLLEYRIAALLFQLYAELFEKKTTGNQYIRQIKRLIHSSYMEPLRVEKIAEDLNLNRRYLSRVFKQATGKSIQEYLIAVRMEEARHRLEEGHSVTECAHLCGYEDVSNFSKIFKHFFGMSPQYWKK